MTRLSSSLAALACIAALPAAARAADVTFRIEQGTAWGESVYVLGDRAELGGADPTRALRMVPEAGGGRWSLTVSIPDGARYRYRFLVRSNRPESLADANNGRWVSNVIEASAPGARFRRVRVRYFTGFADPKLRYRRADGDWRDAAMTRAGNGRNRYEAIWEAEVETLLPELELVPHDGAGRWDHALDGGNYRTGYGAFTLRDGQVHPADPSPYDTEAGGRVHVVRRWYSNILRNARDIYVYLPRGYESNGGRRYPVLYVQDGQNIFGPDAMFGGWRVEQAADRLIRDGRMRETIIIGVANTAGRMQEYVPDEDGGAASRYGEFLAAELKPWVDRTYRTLSDARNTALMGSSLGGLVSVYLGWRRSEVFGNVASLSGSFWIDAFVGRLEAEPARAVRIWVDSGNAGNSNDSIEPTLRVRDALLRKGFTLGDDVGHFVDYGASHNEVYWRARVHRALEFLFPTR